MEKRKIVYSWGTKPYEVLKPRTDRDGWHSNGKKKSLKAINDLLLSGKYEIHTTDGIMFDISEYRREQQEKSQNYLTNKGLESKTI